MGTKPFQLLEINIISAQDLEPITKKMCTYAKAWVHPTRKLASCVDTEGNNNPTWNDKFVFRVDEGFLRGDTSAVMIEIYTQHWFRDVVVGTVRVLVGNLIPPPSVTGRHHMGMRFIALQVRRPSGRPQGILNIGVTVLDGSLRSMPLYNDCMSAVGYRDLMQDPHPQRKEEDDDDDQLPIPPPKPVLRRSRSERSTCVPLDDYSPRSSMVGGVIPFSKLPLPPDGSIISISEFMDPSIMGIKKKAGKASSVINCEELREKPKHKCKKSKASSVISGGEELLRQKSKQRGKKVKGGSVISLSFKKRSPSRAHDRTKKNDERTSPRIKLVDDHQKSTDRSPIPLPTKLIIPRQNFHDYAPPKGFKASSVLSGSEIGPSPSEVAAIMAERRYPLQQDNQSSVLDGWSLNESVEGLKSKLERWRTELPPLYDHHGYGGGSSAGSYRSSVTRRRGDSDSGVFSCFGTICGLECQCTFGKPSRKKKHGGRYSNSSIGSTGRSFL